MIKFFDTNSGHSCGINPFMGCNITLKVTLNIWNLEVNLTLNLNLKIHRIQHGSWLLLYFKLNFCYLNGEWHVNCAHMNIQTTYRNMQFNLNTHSNLKQTVKVVGVMVTLLYIRAFSRTNYRLIYVKTNNKIRRDSIKNTVNYPPDRPGFNAPLPCRAIAMVGMGKQSQARCAAKKHGACSGQVWLSFACRLLIVADILGPRTRGTWSRHTWRTTTGAGSSPGWRTTSESRLIRYVAPREIAINDRISGDFSGCPWAKLSITLAFTLNCTRYTKKCRQILTVCGWNLCVLMAECTKTIGGR